MKHPGKYTTRSPLFAAFGAGVFRSGFVYAGNLRSGVIFITPDISSRTGFSPSEELVIAGAMEQSLPNSPGHAVLQSEHFKQLSSKTSSLRILNSCSRRQHSADVSAEYRLGISATRTAVSQYSSCAKNIVGNDCTGGIHRSQIMAEVVRMRSQQLSREWTGSENQCIRRDL